MAVASLLLPLLAAAPAIALVSNAPPFPNGTEFTVRRMRLEDDTPIRTSDSELRITDHVVRLRREEAVSVSSMYVQGLRKQAWARTEADVRLGVSLRPPCRDRVANDTHDTDSPDSRVAMCLYSQSRQDKSSSHP